MNFAWNAQDYFNNSTFQYDHAKQALSRYHFSGNESVLDVGCGDGKITAEIADTLKNGFVLGVDNSESMIKFANTEFAKNRTNLTFDVCPAEKLNYLEKFDLLTSFACLHWVKDQLAFLLGAKNAIKSDGRIILTLYPKHHDIWQSIDETANSTVWREFFHGYENPHICYNKEIYEKLSTEAGLKIKHLEEHIPVAYFNSKNEMESFLKSWLPHTDQVHPQLRDKFITDIGNTFMKKSNTNNKNQIGMPFRRLDVILTK